MKIRFLAVVFTAVLACSQAFGAATLLPNGEQCFSATTPTSGASGTGSGFIGVIGTITGGTGGVTGIYGGVALTGGSGTNATANITVSGGSVTAVTILNPGLQYVVGDVLSAVSGTIGGVTGFSFPVSSASINSALAGGSVSFFQPNTNTFKSTWFNPDQSANHQNTNPVQLDANGCAIIYGVGSYRQVLKDSLSNTVWDQVTTDTSANNNTFWAGVAGGTPNAITVVDPGFNGTDGSIINFTALATNTGPATLNPSGFGAISILKSTTGGPVSLTGGEIQQGNPISVLYSAVANSFNLLNPPIQSASGATSPLCGAVGLKITNNGTTPNTIINLTADQMVTQSAAGLVLNRSNVSLTAINISTGNTTSTANGMDGEAPGTSQWLNIWAIDNGAASAGLVSVSATAPNLPSGYNFKCRLGAMRVDGSGNLLRTIQLGSVAQYSPQAAGNTTAYPTILSQGTTLTLWTSFSLATFVPPTATELSMTAGANLGSAGVFALAANGNSTAATDGIFYNAAGVQNQDLRVPMKMVLETNNLFVTATGGINVYTVNADGWKDKVNAN